MKVTRQQLHQATQQGILEAQQAEALWQFLNTHQDETPNFKAAHILYYFGGLLAIGAMSLFMTLGWSQFGGTGLMLIALMYAGVGIALLETVFNKAHLSIPAGIISAFIVVLAPLAIYGLQSSLGMMDSAREYRDYHVYIDWRWIIMELGTLVVGVLMLWRYQLPFSVMPIAVTLWYMSMDLTPFLFGDEDHSWQMRKIVSVCFGAGILIFAFLVDLRHRFGKDYAFWLYLFGILAFWGGLSSMDSGSEFGKFLYLCINLAMIAVGAMLSRRVFAVFGGFGVAGYVGHLAYQVFKDSLMFPFALTFIGFAVIGAGIWWQKHEQAFTTRMRSMLPNAVRELLEQER